MKEKVKLKDIKIKDKQAQKKGVSFLEMWKAFWSPEVEEVSEVETIMKDEKLSNEMKELLVKSLKNADSIVRPTEEGISRKVTKLKVEAGDGINQTLKEKQVNINNRNIQNNSQEEKSREDD